MIKKIMALALAGVIVMGGMTMLAPDQSYAGSISKEVTFDGKIFRFELSNPMMGFNTIAGSDQNIVEVGETVTISKIEIRDETTLEIIDPAPYIAIISLENTNGVLSAGTTLTSTATTPDVVNDTPIMKHGPMSEMVGSSFTVAMDESNSIIMVRMIIKQDLATVFNTTLGVGIMADHTNTATNTDGSSPATVNVEQLDIITATPKALPTSIDKNGNMTSISGSVWVQNFSAAVVEIKDVSIVPKNGYVLKAVDPTYFDNLPNNTKEFSSRLGFVNPANMKNFDPVTMKCGVDASVPALDTLDFAMIYYEFDLGAQTTAKVNEVMADVVFDLDFVQ